MELWVVCTAEIILSVTAELLRKVKKNSSQEQSNFCGGLIKPSLLLVGFHFLSTLFSCICNKGNGFPRAVASWSSAGDGFVLCVLFPPLL